MEILAHRGLWNSNNQKNKLNALIEALKSGFGIETDIRDAKGEIVISHDIPTNDVVLLEELLRNYCELSCKSTIALNIKADGLQCKVKALLDEYRIKNYFLFDMSVPEMVENERWKLNFFTRESDIEKECILYDKATGVWMDSFFDEHWYSTDRICEHVKKNKRVAIISPEIHGFNYRRLWEELAERKETFDDHLMLCTDMPNKAREFFYDKN